MSLKGASLVKGIAFDSTDPEVSGRTFILNIKTFKTTRMRREQKIND